MKKRKLWISISSFVLMVALILSLVGDVLPTKPQAGKKETLSGLKDDLSKLQSDKKEIDKEIKNLEGQLKANLKDMQEIVDQKDIIDQQIFMLYQKIDNINEQITLYSSLIAEKQDELDIAEARLAELTAKNKERIRAMEEDGELSYWSVLFKANSFSDLLDRLNMIEEIAASDRRRLQEMNEAAKVVEAAKKALEDEKLLLEESRTQLEASQAEMELKRDEAEALLDDLLKIGEEYEKLIEDAEEKAAALNGEIKDTKQEINKVEEEIKKEEEAAKPKPNKPTSKPTADDDYVPSDAEWLVPCKYTRFSSAYGWRIHPVYKDYRFHYGVDLGGPKGTEIKATRSGKVTLAQYDKSAGYYVKIDHGDGFVSIYMHMTHYIVKKGDKVEAGEVIGYMGSTGTSTGSHLHFGITHKGNYVNPAKYINI